MTQPLATGSNTHLVFHLYYEVVDPWKLIEFIDADDKDGALYYIAETVMSLLPDEAKREIEQQTTTVGTVLRNFCEWDLKRALKLRQYCDNPKMFIGYYRPFRREYYMEDEDSYWYGTCDLVFKLPPKYEMVFNSRSKCQPRQRVCPYR